MARPRTFDHDTVVDRALDLFWEQGFEGTGVAALVEATGVGRQSLYGAYGSKAGLYDAALARYVEATTDTHLAVLDGDGPVVDRIAAIFAALVVVAEQQGSRGCFVVNAICESPLPTTAPDVTRQVLARWEDAFAAALDDGVASGELVPDADVRGLARYLVAAIQGIRVLGASTPGRGVVADAARTALLPVRMATT